MAAIRLQHDLEQFKVPKQLVGTVGTMGPIPASLGRFFRDRTDAAASPSLRAALDDALRASRDLIVLCSHEAAAPDCWVNKEIEGYRRLRPDGRILAIVLKGDPPRCFPPALLTGPTPPDDMGPTVEPLAADMRKVADGPREAVLKLVAALIGTEFDRLRRWREAAAQRRRRIALGLGFVYVVSVTGGAVLATNAYFGLARSRSLAITDRAHAANERGEHDLAMLLALAALPPRDGAIAPSIPEAEAELARGGSQPTAAAHAGPRQQHPGYGTASRAELGGCPARSTGQSAYRTGMSASW